MDTLWDFIAGVHSEHGKLPLVHSTDIFRFDRIRHGGHLKAQKDDIYENQRLIYLFYGRPAYRPHLKEKTLSSQAFAPACLIFDHILSDDAIRILPFDSGAFHAKMIHPPMHPDMTLNEYELAINCNAPMKLIQVFFGNEHNYFNGKWISVEYDDYTNFHVDSYYKLIRLWHNQDADDRVSAIELHFNKDVALDRNVQAVILPGPFLDRPGVVTQIENWGAVAIPYDIQETFRPIEIYGAILNRLNAFYKDKELM